MTGENSMDVMRAALQSASRPTEWLPIESAPRGVYAALSAALPEPWKRLIEVLDAWNGAGGDDATEYRAVCRALDALIASRAKEAGK
jgi:hypothetical protein